jgi:hypothetical protein
MHKDIRKYILSNTKIKEISLFPSSFFPGVNFGYANLSILAVEKRSNLNSCKENIFTVYKGFNSVKELGKSSAANIIKIPLKQSNILQDNDFSIITSDNDKVNKCLANSEIRIGDICDCVTGFYSGNDKKFLKVRNKNIRNSKNYEVVNINKVKFDCDQSDVNGIGSEKFYVPIVKGGNTRYYKPDNWFMEWSIDLVDFYKKDKKARYQNSKYYFRKGIAVPMVSSSSITGAIIENRLFDQSIVGVFPYDYRLIYYLLSFFNSKTCNKLIRTINSSTNNSSNYIKKIPFIMPNNKDLDIVTENTKAIVNQLKSKKKYDFSLEIENQEIIEKLYGF